MTAPSSHDLAIKDRVRVHVRGEWIAVEVTRLPDASCAWWAGASDDGRLVTWDASADVEPIETRPTKVGAELHPNGKCACCGEGRCEWCLRTRIAELEEQLAEARGEIGMLSMSGYGPVITRLRDQLGIERHKSELVRDVLRYVEQLREQGAIDGACIETWRAAGRPGLVSDE